MSNDCCGNLKVVAKNKETLDRILKILKYEDSEFCIHRCKDVGDSETYQDGEFWVKDIFVDGAWDCQQFFVHGDHPDKNLVLDYEKDENGNLDYDKKIYGTAHFTDLRHLAKVLDCGFELYSNEPGCCFWEHLACDHTGEMLDNESGVYEIDEDGNDKYDIDYFNEYRFSDEIYGKENA